MSNNVINSLDKYPRMFNTLSYQKFISMVEYMSISTIMRLFNYGYNRAKAIIDTLLSNSVIASKEHYYYVVDKDKYIQFIKQFETA